MHFWAAKMKILEPYCKIEHRCLQGKLYFHVHSFFQLRFLELLLKHELGASHHHHHWLMTSYLGFHLCFLFLFSLTDHLYFNHMWGWVALFLFKSVLTKSFQCASHSRQFSAQGIYWQPRRSLFCSLLYPRWPLDKLLCPNMQNEDSNPSCMPVDLQ